MYKVKLETSGKTYTKSAETIDDALNAMGLDWHDIKGKGTIKVSQGDKSTEKTFNAVLLRRIFGSKEARWWWSGNLKFLLG